MERIKVLHVLTVFNRGGLETMLMNYYRNFDRNKFDFQFLVHRNDGLYEAEVLNSGGIIHRMDQLSFSPRVFFKYIKNLDQFFQINKFDIIHVHNNSFGYYPLKYAKKHRVPVRIIHSHISALKDDRMKVLFGKYLNSKIPGVATDLYACGGDAGKWMFGNRPFTVIPNAIDSSKFSFNTSTRKTVREKFNLLNKEVYINVARFNPQKNLLFLLEVFAEIHRKEPASHLLMIGEGDLRPEIELKIKKLKIQNDVSLLGARSDVNELLQAADYFLFPSLFEGLPVSMVEAQASGIKCFISDGISTESILIPDLVEVLPLEQNAAWWAAKILENTNYERVDVSEKIKAAGYDIVSNARDLEKKYLNLLERK